MSYDYKKPCPPHFKKPKKVDAKCNFGEVEQENIAKQNATIVQDIDQNNFFFVFCGGAKTGYPAIGGLNLLNGDQKVNLDLQFDEEGNMVLNGKTLKGKEIAEGVKVFALREKKISNKIIGDPPGETMESEEDYPVEPQMFVYDDEDYEDYEDDEDYEDYEWEWEF